MMYQSFWYYHLRNLDLLGCLYLETSLSLA
jgi:hypothetical protein